MKVKNIIWISQEILEAEIIVSDLTFDLICFSHPCNFKEGQEVQNIHVFDAENIMKSTQKEYIIKKLKAPLQYELTGKLIDRSKGIVQIGGLTLQLDNPVPKDIPSGEFISFRCARLDLS